MAEEKEKLYSIPLRSFVPKTKRTTKTVKILREYIVRHMKSDNVWIDPKLNDFLWANGTKNPPARIRVKAVKFEDGLVEVSLPELEKEEEKEIKKEEGEKEKEKKEIGVKKSGEVKKRKTEKQKIKSKEKEESDKKEKKSRETKMKKEKTEETEKEKKRKAGENKKE